MKIISNAF
jgi:hypothetical protein